MCIVERFHRDQKVVEDLNRKFYELQKSGELCDFELTTEDGGSFKVHKWVLATISPFFVKILDKDMQFSEKNSETFLVRRVSSSILEKIIQYMYTGKTKISSDTAKEIIDIALFLNLFTLVEYGIQVLIEILNKDNCSNLLKYSETCVHFGEELTRKSLELANKNFDKFVNSSDFLELSSDTIKMLVTQENATYADENLYLAMKKWLTFDLTDREQFVETLMKEIQFEKFSREFAKLNVFDDNPLLKVQCFNKKLYGLMMNNWTQKTDFYLINDSKMYPFNNGKDKFCESAVNQIENECAFFGYNTFDKKNIFICGGSDIQSVLNTCSYYSTEHNKWRGLPSMEFKRLCPSIITLDKKIYVVGGNLYVNEFVKSIEVLDVNELKWSRVCDLKDINRDLEDIGTSCVSHLSNNIYFITRKCVQSLDTRMSNCEILCTDEYPQNIWSSEAYENYIYGFASNDISTFDIRCNKWVDIVTSYNVDYFCHPFTWIVDGRIHIFSAAENSKNDIVGYHLQTNNLSDLSLYDYKYVISNTFSDPQAFFSL